MNFSSAYALFAPLTFNDFVTGETLTGTVCAVIAGEVGPNSYGIFYFVDLEDGRRFEVEECTMNGSPVTV
jgi:hypothetical protein